MLRRVYLDASMSLNPEDFLQTVKTPMVVAEKMSQVSSAGWDFLTEGIRGETTNEGWLKGSKTLVKAFPYTSGAVQLQELFSDYDVESDFLPTLR